MPLSISRRGPAFALLLILVAGCGGGEPEAARRPNIILVSIEATRADHTSLYGYDRPTTAFIDSLAAGGTTFEQAYSVSSWTVPSVASLVTGTFPATHGVVHGVVQGGHSREIQGQEILSADLPHLARTLREAGYKTFGVTANGHLAEELGYGEGFDFYRNLDFKPGTLLDAPSVNEEVLRWRGQIKRSEPYFLWVHYFDPHDAYHARQPWIEDYFPEYRPHRKTHRKLARSTPGALAEMNMTPGDEAHRCVTALYDSEINYVDQGLRDLLTELQVGDDALIVVTSDHGEEFLDHGGFGHASSLFEEQVKVPLVFRLPGGRDRPVVQPTPVSLVDIAPTLLDYLHLDLPAGMQGRSLMGLMGNDRLRPVHDAVWLALDRPQNRLSAVRQGDWKLVVDHADGDAARLYDLAADPREQASVADDHPDRVAALKEVLADLERTYGTERKALLKTEGLSEEEIEKLRSMGYVR